MNAKEIIARKFEKAAFNGYKPDDVDDYLKEISDEFAALQKEKNELERKLEVLADKIREYRDDEEALKDALLIAQKQGNAIVAESKASAEKLTAETNAAMEKLISESKAKSEKMINEADAYSKRTREDADQKAAKIVGDAQNKADEIKAAMDKQQTIQENIIQQTRKEADDFRNKLMMCYKEHIAVVESIPQKCEDEFVRRISAEVERREAERKKQEQAQAQAKAAKQAKKSAQKQPEKPKPAENPAPEDTVSPEQSEEPFKSVAESAAEPPKPVEGKTEDLPFFNSPSDSIGRHGNLKFGKNNNKE
ncbi:MAG: DivIVA domain-containing protein [Ruminococcaceae bacterium]|nr:DivIVA domain-containing protein [Oscillospiraceae bacterium]